MSQLSSADHSVSPPVIEIPREYNAAHDLLERNLRAGRAKKLAYIDDESSCTYGELAERVNRCANALTALGLKMEERVLLCALDGIDWPTAFLGAIKAGIVPVAVNTLLTPADYEYMLRDSRAQALIVAASLLPKFESALAQMRYAGPVIVTGNPVAGHTSFNDLLQGAATEFEPAATTADDSCFWLYSSGSTGAPKGTVHVHSSLIETAELYARPVLGIREDDLVFSVPKLFFAYGLGNSLSFPLAVGATSVLMAERPTPESVFARLSRHRPSILCAVPTIYAAMLAHAALPARADMRLRACVSAGEPLPEEIGRRWHRHFDVDILDGLGSTEMLHIFLSNRPGDVQYGTTGRPVPGYRVRVVNEDGVELPPGEIGELQASGPTSAAQYWNNREKSRATFQGSWLRTGDKYSRTPEGRYVY
ncbi:MAG: benzoate-CoA ligase family protein, partial [Steroidobacteraceae bacterium]